jgi:hypothetical protein
VGNFIQGVLNAGVYIGSSIERCIDTHTLNLEHYFLRMRYLKVKTKISSNSAVKLHSKHQINFFDSAHVRRMTTDPTNPDVKCNVGRGLNFLTVHSRFIRMYDE